MNNNGIHTLSNSPRPKVKVTRNSFSKLILQIGAHYLNRKTKNKSSEAQDSNNSKYWPNKTRISTKFKMATTNITWETKSKFLLPMTARHVAWLWKERWLRYRREGSWRSSVGTAICTKHNSNPHNKRRMPTTLGQSFPGGREDARGPFLLKIGMPTEEIWRKSHHYSNARLWLVNSYLPLRPWPWPQQIFLYSRLPYENKKYLSIATK